MEIKEDNKIFLKVFLLALIILLVNTAYFFYQYKIMQNKGLTGLSIQGVLYDSYSKMSYGTKLFLIAQWGFLIILLFYSFLKDLKTKNIKAQTIDFHVQKNASGNKTDLDTLYEILKDKKEISIPTISKTFNVSEEIAEEWCKILELGELAVIDYPSFSKPIARIIESSEKLSNSKLSKQDSENKFSNTLKIKDFEVFDEISLGNRGYSKSSIKKEIKPINTGLKEETKKIKKEIEKQSAEKLKKPEAKIVKEEKKK